jgi:transglutaminase-like putative cysteine protease
MQLNALDPGQYLAADKVINHHHPDVAALAARLAAGSQSDVDSAREAFKFARDEITHSWDAGDRRLSVFASETLSNRTGLCYAKAHLAVALTRARGIPAGLCYQRLHDNGSGFQLHGLYAVFLDGDWHRLDPRGNKAGIDAQFSLAEERLAWPAHPERGDIDYPTLYRTAAPTLIKMLRSRDHLPPPGPGVIPTGLPVG